MPTGYALLFWNGLIRNAGANKTHRDASFILTKGCYTVREWFIPATDKLIPWMTVCGDEGRKGKGSDIWETDRLGWISSSMFPSIYHPFLPWSSFNNHKHSTSIWCTCCINQFFDLYSSFQAQQNSSLHISEHTADMCTFSMYLQTGVSFPTGYDWLYPRQIFRLKPLGQGRAIQ